MDLSKEKQNIFKIKKVLKKKGNKVFNYWKGY